MKRRWLDGPWLPLGLFLITSVVLWLKLGIRHGGDTPLYLAGATTLLRGQPLSGVANAYAGYMRFVAWHERLGVGEPGLIVTQILLSGLAMLALYDASRRMAGRVAGFIAASVYAINVDVLRFNDYVLTDSVFTSGLVLTIYAALRAFDARSFHWGTLAVVLALTLATVRMNGWWLLPAVCLFLLLTWIRGRLGLWVAATCLIVAVAIGGILLTLRHSGATSGLGPLLYEGWVIGDDVSSRLPMPDPGPLQQPRLSAAPRYLAQHPVACGRLVMTRIGVELAHVRPFYSRAHNLAIMFVYPLLYGLAVLGWRRSRREPFAWLCLGLVGLHLSLVGLTCADWDGRFLLMVLPLVMLWSAVGVAHLAFGRANARD